MLSVWYLVISRLSFYLMTIYWNNISNLSTLYLFHYTLSKDSSVQNQSVVMMGLSVIVGAGIVSAVMGALTVACLFRRRIRVVQQAL